MSDHLLDHPVISTRYFFPRRTRLDDAFLVDCDDAQLACWHRPAPAGRPTFVHFHGNGEVVSDYLPDYAEAIADMDVGVLLAEYRGYGASSGSPQLGKMLRDVECLYERLNVPASRLIVYGRSVGAIFAVELASRHPDLAGLVLESGVADVLQRLYVRLRPEELATTDRELTEVVARHLSHETKLGAYHGPLLVMHTRDDELVTPDHAEANFRWAAGEQKRLVWFDHGGHNGLLAYNWPAYLDCLREFIGTYS